MTRHYFIADSLNTTEQVSELLHQQLQINDSHFHVLSRDNNGLKEHHLHPANLLQQRDLIHGATMGAITGLVIGLGLFCSAVLTMAFWTDTSETIKNAVFIGSIILPILLGAGVGALFGLTQENYKISRFHNALESGQHLLMVDADETRQVAIRRALTPYNLVHAGTDTPTLIVPLAELAA
ncbi:MAG: hypothetical protein V7707_16865 [Motiliproteus sp.]